MRTAYLPYAALLSIVLFFGFLFWFDSAPAYTQTGEDELFQLTTEHLGAISSFPDGFTEFNGSIYFRIDSQRGGLWRTDGTAAGTLLFQDVNPYAGSLYQSGNFLYFTARGSLERASLWRSDGTAAGTVQLTTEPYVSTQFATLGDTVFFRAYDSAHGSELWRTDGTPDGTQLFADLLPDQGSSEPAYLVAGATRLYFMANDELGVRTLWQSDGTPGGTTRVPNALPFPDALTVVGDVLYFVAADPEHGSELWRYDPARGEPALVLDIFPGLASSDISTPVVVNERLFFTADDGVHGRELWQSDGTAAGTQLVRDIVPGADGANVYEVTAVGGRVYFAAATPEAGAELWVSDGTEPGTTPVRDIVPGPTGSSPRFLTALGDQLYFITTIVDQQVLWKSDGTAPGTTALKIVALNAPLTAAGGAIYFSAATDAGDFELWRSDGTRDGTLFLKDVDPNHVGPFFTNFTSVSNRLYFLQDVGDFFDPQNRLWMSDGTTNPAGRIDEQINVSGLEAAAETLFIGGDDPSGPGLWKHSGTTDPPELVHRFGARAPFSLVALGEQLFFGASDTTDIDGPIYDLWQSDGTAAGTTLVVAGTEGGVYTAPRLVLNGKVIATRGNEIWSLDGTPGGTTSFVPDGIRGEIQFTVRTPNAFYFRTYFYDDQTSTGSEALWRSDGTEAGTVQLVSDEELRSIGYLRNAGDALFFVAYTDERGNSIWYTDGQSTAINFVSPWRYSTFSTPPITVAGGQLFFVHDDGTHGLELWKSDGTPAGTVLVKNITPDGTTSLPAAYPQPLFAFGDRLFFGADDGITGHELWHSDGTLEGTFLVKDINPDAADSEPGRFIAGTDRIYFAADDGLHGLELWQSAGTSDSTSLVVDLYGGAVGSSASGRIFFNHTLYFTGDNGLDGRQLWGLRSNGAAPTPETPETPETPGASQMPAASQTAPATPTPQADQTPVASQATPTPRATQASQTAVTPAPGSHQIHLPVAPNGE